MTSGRISVFWQRYAAGHFPTLSDFSEGVRVERKERDAMDTSFDRFVRTLGDDIDWTAPERLRFPSRLSDNTALRNHARADWQHVDPRVQLFAASLVEVLRKRGIPAFVHAAFRAREQQEAHFRDGTSKARWPRASHCQGAAVDIVHGVFAWDLTRAEWGLVGKLGRDVLARLNGPLSLADRFDMEWGGAWDFYDPAHWELVGWKSNIRELPTGDRVAKTPRGILAFK